MLERTSACLDTGARLSLRQKSLFPKSRRLLHSSFWSTQAPDVDHLCLSNNSSTSTATPALPDSHDAPFLDFLYPAPTQAFMTRLSQWERWPRRNPRPNTLRGYSSLNSPKDSSFSSASSHAQQELLTLLDSPPADESFVLLDIERAWNLVSKVSQPDPYLLRRAITWFSEKENKFADQHAIDLFAELPDKFRSPSVYRSAIESNMRLNRLPVAMALHKEASLLPTEVPIGSKYLMATFVSQSDWSSTVSVLQQWETYNASAPSKLETANFWNEVTKNLPNTLSKLDELRKLCRQTKRQGETDDLTHELHRLYGVLMNRFILAQSRQPVFFKPGFTAGEVRGSVRRLIEQTHKSGLASTDLYENVLMTLLTLDGCASNQGCSAVIVATYNLYRQSDYFKPTETLLLFITRFWRDHNLAFAGRGPIRNFIGKASILQDWYTHHQKPSDRALVVIMDGFAQRGLVEAVKEHANLYKSLHPNGDLDSEHLWPLLSVHAVNAMPTRAAKQLHSMKEEYGVTPNLRCWNIVQHAYARADDLTGAANHFRMMLASGFKPDEYTYASVLNSYAKRGDIDGVIDILDYAKSNGTAKPTTYMLNCMIVALARNSQMDGAMKALDETARAVKEGRAVGSLTLCFNTMLTEFAWRRNLQATMEIYRRMKEENVPLDENSYGALMLVLCALRQSPSAHKILKTVMPGSGIRPLAFHYAILTSGYMGQEMYSDAIKLESEMDEARVRPTASSRAVAQKAKALYEHRISGSQTDESGHLSPLDLAIEDYQKVLGDARIFSHGTQPQPFGAEATDVSYLIYIHGLRRSFEAVQHLFDMSHKKLAESDTNHSQAPIVLLLTNIMFVHSQAQDWAEVDKYWNLIKSRMDELRSSHITGSELVRSVQHGMNEWTPQDPETARIPPSYRWMLSRPLEFYIRSQFAQSSTRKLVPMMMKLLSQGFQFGNKTWNELIVQLCQTSPPRALLAYTLVEKFMIKDWPGWISPRHGSIVRRDKVFPKKHDNKLGFQYIKARYISKEQLIPRYRTMVYLASALLEVRGFASSGLGGDPLESGLSMRELRKQVGTIPEIREQAPLTLHAVQSMPRIVDRVQGTLLRSQ